MSKPPGDRYPSAGDLGRAARAALRGERSAAPERTVATGAAATRTAETVSAEEATSDAPVRPTAPTRRLAEDSEQADDSGTEGPGKTRRRRLVLAGSVLALAIAAAAVLALTSGGGGPSPSTAGTDAKGDSARQAGTHPKPPAKPAPKTLSKSELIAKADAICTESQATYLATHQDFPEGEITPDVKYSKILAGISTRAVRQFRSLDPPAGVRKSFDGYVTAQERVKSYDREALKAAEAEDAGAYLAARARRNDESEERYDLARAVGLQECSTNR